MSYEVPPTYNIETGNLLYRWLGSFWSGICEDSELLRKMYQANGVLSAQLYQEYTDSLNLSNRNKVPVFHRKMWFPVEIRLSDRNSVAACGVELGMVPTPVIGPQTASPYEIGAVFDIGGSAPYADITAYKLSNDIHSIASITNNIGSPDVIYLNGVNYIIKDSVIYFLAGQDPFNNTNFQSETYEDTEKIILWCVDTLLDREYVYNYVGYVLGLKQESSSEYLQAGNALWDVYNTGASIDLVNVAIGAVLGEPVALTEQEKVEAIVNTSRLVQVVTDANVYTFPAGTELASKIINGYSLHKGEFFTDTVKLYTNLDPTRLNVDNPEVDVLKSDIPALFMPAQFFRAKLDQGIGISWDSTPIITDKVDKNGNYRYYFNVFGSSEDVNSLWSDIWQYCEDNEVACKDILQGYITDDHSTVVGSIAGSIAPIEFFMRNCLKANAMVLVLDINKLSEFGRNNIYTLRQLYKILPAHTYTFVIEKINDICDNYDLAVESETTEELDAGKGISSYAYVGAPSFEHLTYRDRTVQLKWLPEGCG